MGNKFHMLILLTERIHLNEGIDFTFQFNIIKNILSDFAVNYMLDECELALSRFKGSELKLKKCEHFAPRQLRL